MNYMSHLALAHQLLNQTPAWDQDIVRSLRKGSTKVTWRADQPRLRRQEVQRLAALAETEGDAEAAAMYRLSYQFLLRVQSECWPLQLDGQDGRTEAWHSRCTFTEAHGQKQLQITLRQRKNTNDPSTLIRPCVCHAGAGDVCGVCSFAALIERQAGSARASIFSVRPQQLTADLRRRCSSIGVRSERPVGWHSFRRGRASDMFPQGSPISSILQAGGWKSPAVLRYLVMSEIDARMMGMAAVDDSDSDGND